MISSFLDAEEGENGRGGELTGFLDFPATLIILRFSHSLFGCAGGNERSEGGMKCRR